MQALLDRVLPYIKAAIVDDGPVLQLSHDDSPILEPLVGDLLVSYVVDEGAELRFVLEGERARSGVSLDLLRAVARENLARLVNDRGVRLARHGEIVAVLFDGHFEASLMLCDECWPHIHEQLGTELLAVAPARDVLAVAAPQDVGELREVVARIWPDGDHLLTQEIYRRESDGSWSLHLP